MHVCMCADVFVLACTWRPQAAMCVCSQTPERSSNQTAHRLGLRERDSGQVCVACVRVAGRRVP